MAMPMSVRLVDEGARRRLRDDSGNAANRQRKSDLLLIPSVARKINRQKWPHSRLNVREKKIQPIEAK